MSKPMSVIDTDHMVCVAQRRCDDFGVTVEFDPRADTAMTDGRKIVLPVIRQPVTQAAMDKLYGFIIHECGHHTRPGCFEILKNAKPPAYLGALFNIIEDEGMERYTARQWRGDHIALSNANDIILNECDKAWGEMFRNPTPNVPWEEADNGPLVSMILGQIARLKWDTQAEVPLTSIIKALPKPAKELLDELLDEGWHHKIEATTDEQSTWELACDLAKRLYPDREDEVNECASAVTNGSERQDTEATPSEGEGSAGEIPEGYNINWKDAVLSEHDTLPDDGGIAGVGITWEDYTGGKVVLMPHNEINFVDLKTKQAEKRCGYGGVGSPNSFMVQDKESRSLGNQIRRYIQSRARSQVSRHKPHGRLDKASLVKLVLPPIDGGEYNKKLFYTQEKRKVQDTAVTILVDWSGSMIGRKMQMAADAAGRLATVLNKQIGIPVEVLAFTTRYSHCDIGVLKDFKERGLSGEEIARRFSAFYKYSSGNNDADAVAAAHRRLLKRPESRRILIVLSDGAPTDTWKGGHADANLRHVTEAIEEDKRNNIELWGIGIHSSCVERYYTQHQVLNDPADINTTLFAIVKHGYENWRKK